MNTSFSLTKPQIRDRSKTVTRRIGKRQYKPGQILQAVEKNRGLKKGEHVVVMAKLRVVSARWEPLHQMYHEKGYGKKEVIKEGFPDMTPADFIKFFIATHRGCTFWTDVQRIEFEYIEEESYNGK